MNKPRILSALAMVAAVSGLLAVAGHLQAAEASRPNIVFILSDDYGLDGVGCYGSDTFKTPNIDALAQSGLRFENAYCTPLCGPTRCLFITGRYGFRTGGLTNQTAGRPTPTDEPSVAKTLKQAGYVTGHCGKWRQMGALPGDWGFDESITDPTAGGYFWQTSYTKNGELVDAGKEIYYPDVCHAFALDFIQRHREQAVLLLLRVAPGARPDLADARHQGRRDRPRDAVRRQRGVSGQAGGRAGGPHRQAGACARRR